MSLYGVAFRDEFMTSLRPSHAASVPSQQLMFRREYSPMLPAASHTPVVDSSRGADLDYDTAVRWARVVECSHGPKSPGAAPCTLVW
jgi:hypothetical protein